MVGTVKRTSKSTAVKVKAPRDPWSQTTTVDKPHATFKVGDWEWRVLKASQQPDREGVFSRWFCAVKSPFTWDSWEYGDCYISSIPGATFGYRGKGESQS